MSWKPQSTPSRDERVRERQGRINRHLRERLENMKTAPPVAAVMGGSTSGKPIAKLEMLQHLGYMAIVKKLGYCMRCGCVPRKGQLQFCHRDQGKGMGIKTDVRGGWPGCAGCHHLVGTSGALSKEERRAEEDRLGAKTRAEIKRRGWWPKTLAELPE
ncbi:MAG: hypothetical protein JWQ03_1625 [Variovorax sp.]|nr:hypothetical protein [Variovorax sp.]